MGATLTTFSAAQENIQKFEAAQLATPPAPVTPEVPAAVVTPETPPEPVVTPEVPVIPSEEDESSSSFNISSGIETPETPATPAQPTPQTYNWKDEVKKLDRKEILKELGVTDFAIEINDHIAKGGKPVDYLSARAVDYNAISDESLVKDGIKKLYPGATPAQVDLVYNRKYAVGEDASEEDKMFAELQLKSDAHNLRQTAIAEQSKFKVPDAIIPQDEAYLQWKESQNTQAERTQQITDFYAAHQATKNLHESKRVTISLGDGVKPYNFIVDKPDAITNAFTDGGQTWQKLTSTATGEPDVPKQQLIALFSYNPQQFIQSIFNYGKSMGVRKELVEGGQNAQRQPAKVINADPNAKPTYKTGTYSQ